MTKLFPLIALLVFITAGGIALSVQNSYIGSSQVSAQNYAQNSSNLFLKANINPGL